MNEPLQLVGQIDNRDELIEQLQEENHDLKVQLRDARSDLATARKENARAIASLRHQLSPLYKALQQVFGEMESFGPSDGEPRVSKVWDAWKSKLGEGPGKIIDALLLHGEMNTQQLAIATGYHRTTIPAFIYKLNQAGLLNKNGGRFALKELP